MTPDEGRRPSNDDHLAKLRANPNLDVSAQFLYGSIPVSERICGVKHIQDFQCLREGDWYAGDSVHGAGVTKGPYATRTVDICEIRGGRFFTV